MKRFRFAKIKEVKERLLEEKEREVKDVLSSIEEVKSTITITEKTITDNYNRLSEKAIEGNDFNTIKEYITALEGRKDCLLKDLSSLIKKADVLKSELTEMLKGIKMLETMQERELKVFQKATNKRQQKAIDEIALRMDRKR